MIIGNLSLDPRNVMFAQIQRDDAGWYIGVTYKVGDSVTDIQFRSEDYEELVSCLVKIDDKSYKGPLADALATNNLDDDDEIDDMTITDALIESTR